MPEWIAKIRYEPCPFPEYGVPAYIGGYEHQKLRLSYAYFETSKREQGKKTDVGRMVAASKSCNQRD